jgi:DNA-binding CsgD family transcriptional regulator
MSRVSPVLVGRVAELATLDAVSARVRRGTGGAVFLAGPAGIGKTRLASAAAARHAEAGGRVIRCRASTVPLRAVSEAVFAAMRTGAVDAERLGEFWPVVWRLVVGKPGGLSDPLPVRAEAVLRVLARSAGTHGCLVQLEDLHDADADTLDILDYLIDNLADQPVLLLVTMRADDGPALALATSAVARRTATLLRLPPLSREQTAEMAAGCLAGDVPQPVLDRLHRDAEGIPFVVEELLSAMVEGGALHRRPDGWSLTTDRRTPVPTTVTASVRQRVERIGPDAVTLLRAAAVLGRRFALPIAAATAALSTEDAWRSVRDAERTGLVGPDADGGADHFAFQHALTAEAILDGLPAGERVRLSRRAAAVVEAEDATETLLAADLWAAGDRPERAVVLYHLSGRLATDRGALATAAAVLDRALTLVDADTRSRMGAGTTADVLEELVRVLLLTGDATRAYALAERLGTALVTAGAPVERRIAARLARARAAAMTGQWEQGLDDVRAARELTAGLPADAASSAPIDAAAAQLVIGSSRPGRLAEALELAGRALEAAEAAGLPHVACEALEVLGRCARASDFDLARQYAERARSLAEQHALTIWQVRAMLEIGTLAKYLSLDPLPLHAARRAAAGLGAVVPLVWIDLSLAHIHILRDEPTEAGRYIEYAARAASRLRLRDLELFALGVTAAVAAIRGRRDAMEAILSRVDDRVVLGYGVELWGYLRGICALLDEDHDRALDELGRAMVADRDAGQMRGSGYQGPYLLLRVVHRRGSWAEYEQLAGSHLAGVVQHQPLLAWSRAVLLGRDGRTAEAGAAAEEALALSVCMPAYHHLAVRLAAPCALEDGWGDPLRWLRAAEDYYHRVGVDRVAAACRALLRGAGTVPRQRRAGDEKIPLPLRQAGVTVREYDVLRLLTERLGNIEIAERLFLSPRTVERHVASLRRRIGQPDRAALIAYARKHVGQ